MERSTVGSVLRTEQAYCAQLCDKETLTYGITYSSPRFAALPEANQFREVVVEDDARLGEAFEQAETWFADRDLFCYRWVPAGGAPTPALASFLIDRGFDRKSRTVMTLAQWVDIEPREDVRILPARAMRAAVRDTFASDIGKSANAADDLCADAYEERMNDPSFDAFVAMVDKQPAGRAALYQVGDIARLIGPVVQPAFADRGVEEAMLAQTIAMAKRLAMRNICAVVDGADAQRLTRYEAAGFATDGEIIEFERGRPDTESGGT